uniref:Uncharacterized protein n=1 Tax=Meloidogyne hapla TaxID=6305 RepID=A0A1I8B220_MELHA
MKNFPEVLKKIKESINYCQENLNQENCTFIGAKEHEKDKEVLHLDGKDIGLDEVDNIPKRSKVILKDPELIRKGAIEMRRQLLDLSTNGQALRVLLTGNDNKKLFSKTSGFVLSNVRYLRAFYCVQVLIGVNKLKDINYSD